jgi:hypothetical protein
MREATLLIALALWTAGCQPARPPAQAGEEQTAAQSTPSSDELAGTSRLPTAQERAIIRGLMDDAAAVRSLPFLQEVPAEIQDEARIRAFVEADIDPVELREARDLYTSLGLLPSDVDLEALLLEVLGEQIVGYYDPKGQRLVVRDDVMRSLARSSVDEARVVLVHELVHALQDQHLRLGVLNELERDSDAENAYHALVEGDATLAMVAYVLSSQGTQLRDITDDPQLLQRFFESGAPTSGADALDRAPAILRVTLMAPYTRGALFCGDRHRLGGWRSVDGAHALLPISTEQVLHPEKYQAGELPDVVPLPTGARSRRWGSCAPSRTRWASWSCPSTWRRAPVATRTSRPPRAGRVTAWPSTRAPMRPPPPCGGRPGTPRRTHARPSRRPSAPAAEAEGSVVLRHGRAVMILRQVPTLASAELTARFTEFARALPAGPPHR